MKDNFEHIDELIAKVIAREATPEESAWLEHWANESEANRVYVDDSKKLFIQIDSIKEERAVDTDKAWNKLNARIDHGDAKIIELPKPKRTFQIAAAVILLICMSFLVRMWVVNSKEESVELATISDVVERKLPDGTKVSVNKNSKLSYAMKDNVREVKLEGEAYFEVVHNEEQPFVINVDGIMIKDIGTEFNVKALPNTEIVEVKVNEGEVQFFTENDEGLKLVKGEKANYSKTSKRFTKVKTDMFDNSGSYHSKLLNFKASRLADIIEELNSVGEYKLAIGDPKIANCRITISFNLNTQTSTEVVELIAEIMNLKVEKKNGTYILNGGNCPTL